MKFRSILAGGAYFSLKFLGDSICYRGSGKVDAFFREF